jgi:hypothetical protein
MRLALLLFVSGCSAAAPPLEHPPVEHPPAPSVESGGSAPTGAPESTPAAASPEATPGPSEGPSASTPPLPSLSVKYIGMHVGGGANDAASKAPFVRAIEQRFPAFLECYRLAAEPGSGGTFGIDLRIPVQGGSPEVEQPRTAIPGDAFKECMLKAFRSVTFEPPKKPVVISYSLRFTLESK